MIHIDLSALVNCALPNLGYTQDASTGVGTVSKIRTGSSFQASATFQVMYKYA